MSITLGLDLGTGSIGWGISDTENKKIIASGVTIFNDGLAPERNGEKAANQKRREYRQVRRQLQRKKYRRSEVLKTLLSLNWLKLPLPLDSLESATNILKTLLADTTLPIKKSIRKSYSPCGNDEHLTINFRIIDLLLIYSKHALLINKPEINDIISSLNSFMSLNPYTLRVRGLDEKITLEELARIIFQFSHRRGFLSSRKQAAKEEDKEHSIVKKSIADLQKQIEDGGYRTLGEYLSTINEHLEPLRGRFTHRSMYIHEFNLIWEKQSEFYPELSQRFTRLIKTFGHEPKKKELSLKDHFGSPINGLLFFKRPLKSQKQLIGTCKFEGYWTTSKNGENVYHGKQNAAISHPYYELFRSLQIINNISLEVFDELSEDGIEKISLTLEQREALLELFDSQDKVSLKDLKNQLKYKGKVHGFSDSEEEVSKNYKAPGNITRGFIKKVFGKHFPNLSNDDIHLFWNLLFFYEDNDLLYSKIMAAFPSAALSKEDLYKFNIKVGYGSISLKAIRKINKYLEQGFRYSDSVLFANLIEVYKSAKRLEFYRLNESKIISQLKTIISTYRTDMAIKSREIQSVKSLTERVQEYLLNEQGLGIDSLKKLWIHAPRITETHQFLPKLNYADIKNPVVHKVLSAVTRLVNEILETPSIPRPEKVIIELARELNSKSKRLALRRYQNEQNKKRDKARNFLKENGISDSQDGIDRMILFMDSYLLKYEDENPTSKELKKAILFLESLDVNNAKAQCPYTGDIIGFADVFSANPTVDIDHIIPLSKSLDDSLSNMVLANKRFNESEKGNQRISSVPKVDAVVARYKNKADKFGELIKTKQNVKIHISSPNELLDINSDIEYYKLCQQYYYSKYSRLSRTQSDDLSFDENSFLNRQLTDTGYITRLALSHLKSVFGENNVQAVKGASTSTLRKAWGLPPKNREVYYHHAEDAIIVSLTNIKIYKIIAEQMRNEDAKRLKYVPKSLPWESFNSDFICNTQNILVNYQQANQAGRIFSKYVKTFTKKGMSFKVEVKSPRGSLHDETIGGTTQNKQAFTYRVIPDAKILNNINGIVHHTDNEFGVRIKRVTIKTSTNEFRIPIEHLKINEIKFITEPTRTIVFAKLNSLNINLDSPKTIGEELPYMEFYVPAKKITQHIFHNKVDLSSKNNLPRGFADFGNTYATLLFKDYRTGKLLAKPLSFADAIHFANMGRDFSSFFKEYEGEIVDIVKKNDLYIINYKSDELSDSINAKDYTSLRGNIYRIQKMNATSLDITLRGVEQATVLVDSRKVRISSTKKWQELNPIKIGVDLLGGLHVK